MKFSWSDVCSSLKCILAYFQIDIFDFPFEIPHIQPMKSTPKAKYIQIVCCSKWLYFYYIE